MSNSVDREFMHSFLAPVGAITSVLAVGVVGSAIDSQPMVGAAIGTCAGFMTGAVSGLVLGGITYGALKMKNSKENDRQEQLVSQGALYDWSDKYVNFDEDAKHAGSLVVLGCTGLGILGGATYGTCGGFSDSMINHSKVKTEVTTERPSGFNQTMHEAIDEFRIKTGESVYMYGQKAVSPVLR